MSKRCCIRYLSTRVMKLMTVLAVTISSGKTTKASLSQGSKRSVFNQLITMTSCIMRSFII